MGTWGFNILDDDFARDVHGDYLKHFNAGRVPEEIMRRLLESYESAEDDEGPVFWIAVAKAQWDCGHLDPSVVARVKSDFAARRGLDVWEAEGPKVLAKREAKVSAFIEKLTAVNPKPRKPKPPTKRKPVFEAGDCMAVRLGDGDYGAMLVLAAGDPERGPDDETFGSNIVGMLRYKAAEKPGMDVFERREWMRLTHHSWAENALPPSRPEELPSNVLISNVSRSGFRQVKDRFEVVGRTSIRAEDPKSSRSYWSWVLVDQVEMQDRWDRGIRD